MTIQDRIGKYLKAGRSWYTREVNTITVLTVHHDAIPHDNRTADQVMQQIMNIHVANGWPGASYHYYIHRDGQVYQMNKHEWVTWHDGHNWDSIGIVVNGYFHSPYNNDPVGQLSSLKELLDWLCKEHPEFPADQRAVWGHRERGSTACPGDRLYPYVKEYRDKVGNVSWGPQPPTPPTTPTVITDENQLIHVLDKDLTLKQINELITSLNTTIEGLDTEVTRLQKIEEKYGQVKTKIEEIKQIYDS